MLHPHIEVRVSPIAGRGLFITQPIHAGEVVWRAEPNEPTYTRAEIARFDAAEQAHFWSLAYQVGPDTFHGPRVGEEDPADFMNHACEPTCWFVSDVEMVAIRTLAPGEEVTYDYATSEHRADFDMRCTCGAASCRRRVRGTDLRDDPALRARYRGHLMSHVGRALEREP